MESFRGSSAKRQLKVVCGIPAFQYFVLERSLSAEASFISSLTLEETVFEASVLLRSNTESVHRRPIIIVPRFYLRIVPYHLLDSLPQQPSPEKHCQMMQHIFYRYPYTPRHIWLNAIISFLRYSSLDLVSTISREIVVSTKISQNCKIHRNT